ncbi:hypothetical protein PANT_7c00083 [Moesziomyces antarcticus T-34]|uniref:Uncharacterized protein n=1 Tax=Pseudozyma antarctica (strain T-34) TaxID=1151754 RepID=M9LTX8_PSEA3|nr:hypothetical protein PANT_7c00083 [Moesziomyces antarcticus T-34]
MPGGLFGRSRPRDLTVHVNPARTGGPVVDPEPQMSTMTVSRHITSAPKETAVNLFFYYFFYLLLMASAVITIIFAQRPSSNFDQTFDVQSLPGVIFAWNRDAAVTPVSAISSGGDESVESATCTPYNWDRGTRVGFDCTSIAPDGQAKLVFSLYSTTPYPPTVRGYRATTDRYDDVSVPTYYVKYYTYLPPRSTSSIPSIAATASPSARLAARDAVVQAQASSSSYLGPSRTQVARTAASATLAPEPLHARQVGDVPSSATSATPAPLSSLSLIKIEYVQSSMSALVGGTIVSVSPMPSPSTVSINARTAKMNDGFKYFFSAIAVVPAFFATLTIICVSYNLSVAARRVRHSRRSSGASMEPVQGGQNDVEEKVECKPRPSKRNRRAQSAHVDRDDNRWTSDTLTAINEVGETDATSTMSKPSTKPPAYESGTVARRASVDSRSVRPGARAPTVMTGVAQMADGDSAPPAYESRPPSRVDDARTVGREDDDIEVIATPSESESEHTAEAVASFFSSDRPAPDLSLGAVDSMAAPRTSTKRSSSLLVGWMVLPIYAYMFWWDYAAFIVVGLLQIAAFSLAADAMLDVGKFVRDDACLGDGDNYSLYRSLCGRGRFRTTYPLIYSNTRPRTTIWLFASDLLILQISLVVLFVANLGWMITIMRKTALTERNKLEPDRQITNERHTGRSGLGYIVVLHKTGNHGKYGDWNAADDVYALEDMNRAQSRRWGMLARR